MASIISHTATTFPAVVPVPTIPPLENGDRLDQPTFHERYEAMPEGTRAELIGGIVYMASPLRFEHGHLDSLLSHWMGEYELGTPGTKTVGGATVILGPECEPQPDLSLLISRQRGGQSTIDEDDYIVGAPELVVEIASSTESYDLHLKKREYESRGVREYVVAAARQQRVFWFALREGKYVELSPGTDGVFRSEIFPGLWLDPVSLFANDRAKLLSVLRDGLNSPEHAAWPLK